MNKCKCILESSWYLIDDSFDKNSNIKSGKFSFKEGEKYEYYEEESAFGKSFYVIIDDKKVGFDSDRFNQHFKI